MNRKNSLLGIHIRIKWHRGWNIFGGLYHDLYKGNVLYTLPLVNVDPKLDEPARFHITLQNLTTSINGTNSSVLSEKHPALLSTSSMFTYLPEELFDSFVDEMDLEKGAKHKDLYIIPCDTNATFIYDFGGFEIETPLSGYTFKVESNRTTDDMCAVMVKPHNKSYLTLGNGFFAATYVLFDLENLEISMAPASGIEYLDAFDYEYIESSIPSASRAASYSNTWILNQTSSTNSTRTSPPPTRTSFPSSRTTSRSTSRSTSRTTSRTSRTTSAYIGRFSSISGRYNA